MLSAPKIHPNLLWNLTLLFVVLAITYFLGIFFYRNKLTNKAQRILKLKRELSPIISEFIFHEEEDSKNEKSQYIKMKIEIREIIKDDFSRSILTEILLDLRKDISGEAQKRLLEVYQDLGLHHDAFAQLKSWRWEKVSKAILDLTLMQVPEAYRFMTKFINDKRSIIRKQAEIAVVSLKHEGLNYFLDTTQYKISEWQQLKLIEVIRNLEQYQPPKFKAWLTSTNTHVVLFALRLIKYYNQNDAKASLIELIKHKNNQIKEQAISCIKEFYMVDALPTLKAVFSKSATDIKIAILEAIAIMGNPSDIDFLRSVVNHESNFAVKSKAVSSINAIAPDSIIPTIGIENPDSTSILNNEVVTDELRQEPKKDVHKKKAHNVLNSEGLQEITNVLDTASEDAILEDIDLDFLPVVTANPVGKESIEKTSETPAALDENKEAVSIDFDVDALAFLPLVTENDQKISNKIKDSEEAIASVFDLNVTYTVVKAEQYRYTTKSVLPLNKLNTDFKRFSASDIFELTVNYTELHVEKPVENIVVNEPYFIEPSIINVRRNKKDTPPYARSTKSLFQKIMPLPKENIFKKILQKLIHIDEDVTINEREILKSPLLEFENEFIDINAIPNLDKAEESKPQKTTAYKIEIPKSELTDELITQWYIPEKDTEAALQLLLDDLEELGDFRELDVLNELLSSTANTAFIERIENLITRFSKEQEDLNFDLRPNPKINQKAFNVFEDLFQSCDLEAKLILLDEVVTVGDEGDLNFLEQLVCSEEAVLKTKAQQILKALQLKLNIPTEESVNVKNNSTSEISNNDTENISIEIIPTPKAYKQLMNTLEIEPSTETNDIFDIDFEVEFRTVELEEIDEVSPEKEKTKERASMMRQLYSFSTKIYKQLNG